VEIVVYNRAILLFTSESEPEVVVSLARLAFRM